MRSSTLRPWRSLGKTVSTETILTWVQLSSSSLYSPKSSQHSSKTWWAHVCVCLLWAGWSEEGGRSSLMGHRTDPNWSRLCFNLRWASVLSNTYSQLRCSPSGPWSSQDSGACSTFFPLTWPNDICNTKRLLDPIQRNPFLGFFLWKPRLFWKNLTPSCEVSRCPPPRQCISAHTQQELESLLALSQHQIVKTHELLPSSDLKMSSLKASAGVSG